MNLQELKKRTRGMVVPVVTPFDKNETVDYAGFKDNLNFLASELEGKDAVLLSAGSTGEFYAMSEEERRKVIEVTVDTVAGRVPIYAATGDAGTKTSIAWTKWAQAIGADGAMVVLPFYHAPTEEGMYLHFKAIAESVDFGIMIYNNPSVSSSWIRPPLMARLAEIENIIANKENSRFIHQQAQMSNAIDPAKMKVIVGTGELAYTQVILNSDPAGYVSADANFAPALYYSIWENVQSRNYGAIKDFMTSMRPYYKMRGALDAAVNCSAHGVPYNVPVTYVSMTKHVMNTIGLCGGHVRGPLVDVKPGEVPELAAFLQAMRLLPAEKRAAGSRR